MRLIDPTASSEWDALVANYPEATFFHQSAWAKVLRDCYGFQPLYIVGGSEFARWALPLMEVRSLMTGHRGVSLPFSDYCDPLISGDCQPGSELLSELTAFGQSRRWRYVEFHGAHDLFPLAPSAVTYHLHELDLSLPEEHLWEGVESSTRRAVRRARAVGVTVRTGRLMEDVRAFYALHCETRRKHGLPPQPFRFFEYLHQHVIAKGLGTVFLAYHNGAIVAAALFVHANGRVTYKFGASDEQELSLRPNNLLMWEAICHFRAAKFHQLSFGRTSPENAGLRRFKLGWGARESALDYFRFDLTRGAFTTAEERTTGWHNQVFRHLPLSVSRLCGQLLYRHMA
jgi:CelD/BcsL family acetyltransferase involved in cellulose biosynthesis